MNANLPSYDGIASKATKFGRWGIGMGTPAQQILATTIVFFALVATSAISAGATLVLAPVVAFWWILGVFRLVPGVNQFWPL